MSLQIIAIVWLALGNIWVLADFFYFRKKKLETLKEEDKVLAEKFVSKYWFLLYFLDVLVGPFVVLLLAINTIILFTVGKFLNKEYPL